VTVSASKREFSTDAFEWVNCPDFVHMCLTSSIYVGGVEETSKKWKNFKRWK
jgi:hypothetical protein